MTSALEILASDYALDILSDADRQRAETRMSEDEAFAEQVAWWTNRFAPLLDQNEGETPPADLFAAIEERLNRQTASGSRASTTVRDKEGRWIVISPGVRRKHLFHDDADGVEAFLLELDPGASLPEHDHPGPEDCLVLSGDFIIGDLRLTAGDYHAAPANSGHACCRSESGCRLFIRGSV